MDKWIKENKITSSIILIILVIFAISIFYSQSVQTSNNFNLQSKCSSMSGTFFTNKNYKISQGDEYKNHYNSKLDKCFILISSYDIKTDILLMDLYDALEGGRYGSFTGHNNCYFASSLNKNKDVCWLDSGDIWLGGNDTKNADTHVGFQGAAIGSGLGDNNTKTEFLKYIEPFMNE